MGVNLVLGNETGLQPKPTVGGNFIFPTVVGERLSACPDYF